MKFITHDNSIQEPTKWVYLQPANKVEDEGPQNTLLGSLNLNSGDGKGPILSSRQEDGSGINAPDTAATFQKRVNEIVKQSSEGAINSNLGGSYLSKIFVPPEFQGYTNLYLLNPFFLAPAAFTPVKVIGSQLQEGFDSLGDPAELLGDSPLLSIKSARTLVKKENVDATIKGLKSGGGDLEKMSLTSIQMVEQVNDEAFKTVSQINETRAAEFFAKSGYNLETGERDSETGAVWYKRWARVALAQNFLYRRRVKLAKARYKEGIDEARSNIRSLKQQKEERVFGVQQEIDGFFMPLQAEGSADTLKINAGRKVIQLILNRPNLFVANPNDFEIDGVSAKDIFGSNSNPLDVIEALRAPNMEYIVNKKDSPNYLESAITVNNWKLNAYNTEKARKGLNTRVHALRGFDNTSLEAVENYVLQHYEASDEGIEVSNPNAVQALNAEIFVALGAAVPGELRDLQAQIRNGNVYMEPVELFWHLMSFLGKDKNLGSLRKLPPQLQGKLARFLIDKRTQLEKATVAGGLDEQSSLVFRAEMLKQAELVADSIESFAAGLPTLAEKLISTDKGVAQEALRQIPTLFDSFRLFFKFIGAEGKMDSSFAIPDLDTLLPGVPEYERAVLSNIINVYPKVQYLQEIYPELIAERKKIEDLIDFDPAEIPFLKEQLKGWDDKIHEGREVGLGQTKSAIEFGSGSGVGPAASGGGDLETYASTASRRAQQYQDILFGKEGSEDGGFIGKLNKITNSTFNNIPGDNSASLQRLADLAKRSIARRRKELGVETDEQMDVLLDADKKASFDQLARYELFTNGSQGIVKTAEALLGHQTAQQFENMKRASYVGLDTLVLARADFQPLLTVEAISNPDIIKDAIYVQTNADGSIRYHTETQVFDISAPRLGSGNDPRNVAIWNKRPEEKGFSKKFTITPNQPDGLAVMLNSNPENSAAVDNPLYGPVSQHVAALISENQSLGQAA